MWNHKKHGQNIHKVKRKIWQEKSQNLSEGSLHHTSARDDILCLQFCYCSKGQLISKCLFEKIVWTKIPTKILIVSALALSGQKLSNFFVGILVETMIS